MDELKKLLATLCPYVGSIIGTASPIAGVLFSAITGLFGLQPNATSQDVLKAIQSDPDAQIKLRSLEIQHSDEILHAQTQIRVAAYNREIEVSKATGQPDHVVHNLAYIFVGGFFLYSFCLFFVSPASGVHDIVLLLAGQISALAIAVANYFFGAMFKSKPMTNAYLSTTPDIILPPPAQTRKE